MHSIDVTATRARARATRIDRKTALTILGGGLAALAGAWRLRPMAVNADHDGT